jgi:hypothetical protein
VLKLFIQDLIRGSLIFITLSGPESPVLKEHSYAVYNDNPGDIDLYIQPGDASNGQQHYVAVFSLLNVYDVIPVYNFFGANLSAISTTMD